MARYDMTCKCGDFEAEAPMKDGPPKTCPKGHKAQQVFSKPPAFHNHLSPMHPRVNRGRGR